MHFRANMSDKDPSRSGNTFEGSTVSDMLSKLSQKFQMRRFIWVGDKGLFSKENLSYF